MADYNNIKDPNKIYENQILKIPLKAENLPNKYIVKKGDTLIKIAKVYGKDWKEIYDKNKAVIGNNPNVIKPGQILYI